VTDDRAAREGRCPDGGYCHGRTLAAGSAPCPEGTCLRVRTSGPLSGVFPGDRWPTSVVRADAVVEGREQALRPFRDLFAGGPDTPCRTTYRDEDVWNGTARTECVEVPLDEVRAAFVEAGEPE
jgi:hypothetical protein